MFSLQRYPEFCLSVDAPMEGSSVLLCLTDSGEIVLFGVPRLPSGAAGAVSRPGPSPGFWLSLSRFAHKLRSLE